MDEDEGRGEHRPPTWKRFSLRERGERFSRGPISRQFMSNSKLQIQSRGARNAEAIAR